MKNQLPNLSFTHKLFRERGVRFRGEPRAEAYGTVAVLEDLYGNAWDLMKVKRA